MTRDNAGIACGVRHSTGLDIVNGSIYYARNDKRCSSQNVMKNCFSCWIRSGEKQLLNGWPAAFFLIPRRHWISPQQHGSAKLEVNPRNRSTTKAHEMQFELHLHVCCSTSSRRFATHQHDFHAAHVPGPTQCGFTVCGALRRWIAWQSRGQALCARSHFVPSTFWRLLTPLLALASLRHTGSLSLPPELISGAACLLLSDRGPAHCCTMC